MITDYADHKRTIEQAIKAIGPLHGSDVSEDEFKRFVFGDLDRLAESEAAFHQNFPGTVCTTTITVSCSYVQQRSVEHDDQPMPPHEAADKAMRRTPIAWGTGTCWYWGNCRICIEKVCRTN